MAGTRPRPLRRVAPCFLMWRTSAPTDAPGCATAQPGASAAQRNQRASAGLTASARRAHRQRTRGPSQRPRLLGADRTGWNGQRGWITCKCGNSRWQEWPSREPVGDNPAKVTGPMRRVLAQVTGWPTSVQRLEPAAMPAAPASARCPIRTHIRRPTRPPLLYFAAVLPVRVVRISLLTSGAKRARTADLLHAIWRQHVHPRPSVQVTVLPRPRTSARVRVSCCTSVLYRCHPRQEHQSCLR